MQNLAFEQLVADVQACRICPRMEGRRRVLSAANGPVRAGVVFVAEAPGRLGGERGGIPLSGDASGRNFNCCLQAAGLSRDQIFITNATLCNPQTPRGTNAPPAAIEVRNCSRFLQRTLSIVRPQVIVTLGAKALAALALISPHRLTLRDHAARASSWNGLILFPLYHPSPQVVVSPTGRSLAQQAQDFRALRHLLDSLPPVYDHSPEAKNFQCGEDAIG